MDAKQASKVWAFCKTHVSSMLTDEGSRRAWADSLMPFDFQDAMVAAHDAVTVELPEGRGRFCEPGDVVSRIRKIRADRIRRNERAREQVGGNPPPDPAGFIAWRRATDRILASPGFDPCNPEHIQLGQTRITQALANVQQQAIEATPAQPATRTHNRAAQLAAITDRIGDAA